MGEYVWTVATVGGKIPHSVFERLDELGLEIGVPDEIPDGKSSLCYQGEFNYGNPEEFMQFCQDHGLPFHVSYAAAPGVFSSGLYFWQPGMETVEGREATDDGEPVLTFSEVHDALAEEQTLLMVYNELKRASGKAVPPLEIEPALAGA